MHDLGQFYFRLELVGFGGTCVKLQKDFIYSLLIHSLNSSCINLAEQYFNLCLLWRLLGFGHSLFGCPLVFIRKLNALSIFRIKSSDWKKKIRSMWSFLDLVDCWVHVPPKTSSQSPFGGGWGFSQGELSSVALIYINKWIMNLIKNIPYRILKGRGNEFEYEGFFLRA